MILFNNKYVMCLSYVGTNYSGWQIQNNASSIQGFIMDALHTIIDNQISLIIGAGRTDSGVHAVNFYAHFESNKIEVDMVKYKLNKFLPDDIVVNNIINISNDFHARYSAISRTYEYWISTSKDPFLINRAYFFTKKLNIELMNTGSKILIGQKDFSSFSKSKLDNNECVVQNACWFKSKNMLIFSIQADRFLHNMVRSIVGTLINLGLEKINLYDFETIIQSQNRIHAGYSVPSSGLYLLDIKYPKKFQLENI